MMLIRVQAERFDAGAMLNMLSGTDSDCGAVASFSGQVRGGDGLVALELEHYPGITEKALTRIATHARKRWALRQAVILHRIGRMEVGEEIVFIGATAPHRHAALEAVSFMIDTLKTQAPFWKKEFDAQGERWVEARAEDDRAAARWLQEEEDKTA